MKFSVLTLAVSMAALAWGAERPLDQNLRLAPPRVGIFGRPTSYEEPSNFYLDSAVGRQPAKGTAGLVEWSLDSHVVARQLSESDKDSTIGDYCEDFPIADELIDWEKTILELRKTAAYTEGFVTVVAFSSPAAVRSKSSSISGARAGIQTKRSIPSAVRPRPVPTVCTRRARKRVIPPPTST